MRYKYIIFNYTNIYTIVVSYNATYTKLLKKS